MVGAGHWLVPATLPEPSSLTLLGDAALAFGLSRPARRRFSR